MEANVDTTSIQGLYQFKQICKRTGKAINTVYVDGVTLPNVIQHGLQLGAEYILAGCLVGENLVHSYTVKLTVSVLVN
ncbi:hypothetical protein D3C85_1442180 [compost metagenome]